MIDKYASFAELAENEAEGKDYRVRIVERPNSPALILAPHGGRIEVGTSELAALVAGDDHNLFSFEGLKPRGRNHDLHITSHRFDHPDSLRLLSRCSVAIGVHGCKGEAGLYVGGLDTRLQRLLTQRLQAAGFPAKSEGHKYPGSHPLNICNRTTRNCGAQLELTLELRRAPARTVIGNVVRIAVTDYLTAHAIAGT